MDSIARSKSIGIYLHDLINESYFQDSECNKKEKIAEESEEIHSYFNENSYLNRQNDDGYHTQQDSDEEQDKGMLSIDNFYMQITSSHLKDIIEEPEESQNNERSSSMNSQNLRRILTNEENKNCSDSTGKSKEGSAASNFDRYSKVIKSGLIKKKGIIFYNERYLTLLSIPRLYYLSNGIERDIELNPTTSIKKLSETCFEIINYYPTTKVRIKAFSEAECEEWITVIQKTILSLESE